jgi:hypothetical protein
MINETPQGQLGKYLVGDLGVARRHLQRLKSGEIPMKLAGMVLHEISNSIEACVARIERDIKDTE